MNFSEMLDLSKVSYSFNYTTDGFMEKCDDDARTKTYTLDVPGFKEKHIQINKKWINREKRLELGVDIKKGDVCKHYTIEVDTDVYDKYEWKCEAGVLTITFHEIINEEPKFDLI